MHKTPNYTNIKGTAHPRHGWIQVPEATTAVANILSTHRLNARLSLRELATLSGIGKSQLSAMENDTQNDIRVSQIINLAAAFCITPLELFQEYLTVLSEGLDNTTKQNQNTP